MKQRVFITGGTGFLGRRLAVLLRNDYEVFIGGRNNNQNQLASEFTGCRALPLDISNEASVKDTFAEIKPNIVIHAAASKYVDVAEKYPHECVDVNIRGSQHVARAAVEFGVDTVIGVSTDKAAPPVHNIYGISKALMEKLFCLLNGKTKTKFTCVRFGNIAWSTGSIFPIWKRMQAEAGVIQSTGPDMTRLIFSLDEAASLVLTALDNIAVLQGNVLSQKMKTVKIRDILDIWVKHYGGSWTKGEARPGDSNCQYLIGVGEDSFTREISFDGESYYVLSLSKKPEKPIHSAVSSENAEYLSPSEITKMITEIPKEASV